MPETSTIEAERAKTGFLFTEDIAQGLTLQIDLRKIYVSHQSKFQKVDVIETYFGKTLVTDGKTQSTQFDEFAYHESLVHPSMLKFISVTGSPAKKVFIGGGGELATAREVLRHAEVEKVTMVDLDADVVSFCKEYLPEWGGEEIASNPRLDLVIGDAYQYILDTTERFDVIIMDISDPIEAGPGVMLYTKEFYEHALTLLNPGGVLVTQSGMAESIPATIVDANSHDPSCFAPIINTLRSVFDCVVPYTLNIPSYGSDWGFTMAFQRQEGNMEESRLQEGEWKRLDHETVGRLVDEGVTGGGAALRYYDGESHLKMFALTKPLRQALEKDDRIITKDNPIFMF